MLLACLALASFFFVPFFPLSLEPLVGSTLWLWDYATAPFSTLSGLLLALKQQDWAADILANVAALVGTVWKLAVAAVAAGGLEGAR